MVGTALNTMPGALYMLNFEKIVTFTEKVTGRTEKIKYISFLKCQNYNDVCIINSPRGNLPA